MEYEEIKINMGRGIIQYKCMALDRFNSFMNNIITYCWRYNDESILNECVYIGDRIVEGILGNRLR